MTYEEKKKIKALILTKDAANIEIAKAMCSACGLSDSETEYFVKTTLLEPKPKEKESRGWIWDGGYNARHTLIVGSHMYKELKQLYKTESPKPTTKDEKNHTILRNKKARQKTNRQRRIFLNRKWKANTKGND